MLNLRRAHERGHAQHGWLDSWHTFSFADYQDAAHMGFRNLRVINEDRVQPGRGFGTHPHRDMEIVTYVLEGALEHKDSMGNGSIIRPGEVQRMSAGTGVFHSEYNASKTEGVHFLQIWIMPDRAGHAPGYEQKRFDPATRRGALRLVASPDGADGSVTVHQPTAASTRACSGPGRRRSTRSRRAVTRGSTSLAAPRGTARHSGVGTRSPRARRARRAHRGDRRGRSARLRPRLERQTDHGQHAPVGGLHARRRRGVVDPSEGGAEREHVGDPGEEFSLLRGYTDDTNLRGYGFDFGATWKLDPWRFTFGYAFGSGDDDATTNTREAFQQTGLQRNNDKVGGATSVRYYGELLDPELSNLTVLTLGVGYELARKTTVEVLWHRYAQVAADASLADTNLERSPDGIARGLGDEVDVALDEGGSPGGSSRSSSAVSIPARPSPAATRPGWRPSRRASTLTPSSSSPRVVPGPLERDNGARMNVRSAPRILSVATAFPPHSVDIAATTEGMRRLFP